ncbi:hypothetical protein J2Z21_009278 [Streptomyces griseochromogenes]|uniref:Uncharacterized protein n=1 Tax=Streptomyces griseochromogenes TaxID=68214 RepID=A0A1B1AZQ5_9ACTN|nr:hypothetical protein AVL59_22940 [Streptomyces griseochromogenes]MBP2056260.1 hypothetical protein [Streptomyces griseochromogenes]
MSELTSTRTIAVMLGLPHLAEALNHYIQRADEAKMGYSDLLGSVFGCDQGVARLRSLIQIIAARRWRSAR